MKSLTRLFGIVVETASHRIIVHVVRFDIRHMATAVVLRVVSLDAVVCSTKKLDIFIRHGTNLFAEMQRLSIG